MYLVILSGCDQKHPDIPKLIEHMSNILLVFVDIWLYSDGKSHFTYDINYSFIFSLFLWKLHIAEPWTFGWIYWNQGFT